MFDRKESVKDAPAVNSPIVRILEFNYYKIN